MPSPFLPARACGLCWHPWRSGGTRSAPAESRALRVQHGLRVKAANESVSLTRTFKTSLLFPYACSVTSPTIGVFALQGDVREHLHVLTGCGANAISVRRPEELASCDALVLPGGESTTMYKLARTFDLFEPLQKRIADGMPTLG
ncbi:MAG: hypothetical protein JJE02_03155, partial [Propionibacteriales bacterium]|nr:hypothetical protein [Propionibacteriales bacterium]